MAINAGLWTVTDMVPKIVETNGDLDVHGMAQYFEEVHRAESVEVVRFLRKFVAGTRVRDLQNLADRWNELSALDSERASARARKDQKDFDRTTAEFLRVGVAVKDFKNAKTGEITTTWEVRTATPSKGDQ
ncbi:MAG: hypothetical protein ABL893_07310 [Hyphomicrobium sp.]